MISTSFFLNELEFGCLTVTFIFPNFFKNIEHEGNRSKSNFAQTNIVNIILYDVLHLKQKAMNKKSYPCM